MVILGGTDTISERVEDQVSSAISREGSEPGGDAVPGWDLTARTTGLAPHRLDCATLPTYTGSLRPASGTVISERRITGPLILSNGNITIERSCLQPTDIGSGMPVATTTDPDSGRITQAPVTIRDSEIDGSRLSDYDAAWATGFKGVANLKNNYVHDLGSGLAILDAGKVLDAEVSGNYVTDLRSWGDGGTSGNHSDGFTVRDFDSARTPGRSLLIRNNRFDSDSGNDTGALFIQTYSGDIDNVTVEGNLLEGDGYQLGLEARFGNTYQNVSQHQQPVQRHGMGSHLHH